MFVYAISVMMRTVFMMGFVILWTLHAWVFRLNQGAFIDEAERWKVLSLRSPTLYLSL